jgi:hypothetical protein
MWQIEMPPQVLMNNAPSDLNRLLEALNRLSHDELVHLNREVVERIRFLRQAKTMMEMTKFRTGDLVEFTTDDDRVIVGNAIRVNQKSVTVQPLQPQAGTWRVHPALLRKSNAKVDIGDTRQGH